MCLSGRPFIRLQHPDWPDPNLHRGVKDLVAFEECEWKHGRGLVPLDWRLKVSAALDCGRLLMEVFVPRSEPMGKDTLPNRPLSLAAVAEV